MMFNRSNTIFAFYRSLFALKYSSSLISFAYCFFCKSAYYSSVISPLPHFDSISPFLRMQSYHNFLSAGFGRSPLAICAFYSSKNSGIFFSSSDIHQKLLIFYGSLMSSGSRSLGTVAVYTCDKFLFWAGALTADIFCYTTTCFSGSAFGF